MKVSKDVAKENRAAVLQAASVVMRQSGVAAASMGEIAALAGLTHGAIYRHFDNKSALAAAVVAFDFEKVIGLLHSDGMTFELYVKTYLSAQHRDYFPWGCPAGALAGEMAKLDGAVQAAFVGGIARNIDALAALIGGAQAREKATAALALMVGALSMARAAAATDSQLSDHILASAAAQLLTNT
jgi:TetR/AcrR family transcriptional repressor of nem operon